MARIAGVNLPREKRLEIALTYIYGVGRPTANRLLREVGISPDTYVKNLTEDAAMRRGSRVRGALTVAWSPTFNPAFACAVGWCR